MTPQEDVSFGEITVNFDSRRRPIKSTEREPGPFPYYGASAIVDYVKDYIFDGNYLLIAEDGENLRSRSTPIAFMATGQFWVNNHAHVVQGNHLANTRFLSHLFSQTDVAGYLTGSTQPKLTRKALDAIRLRIPSLATQDAIAEVLGALDDKIIANTKLAATSNEIAGLIYDQAVVTLPTQAMSKVLDPVLGGTPARANSEFWGGTTLWASAKDITGAPFSVVTNTDEKITRQAVETTKAKPLPVGSVILTARGTVGAVARLAEPSAFNQSCYGFVPGMVPAGLLYFSILRASQQAKAIAHGSVFDTITKRTFDHLHMPVFDDISSEIEARIVALLTETSSRVQENTALAGIRDALLPQLISGKLQLRDAETLVEAVV